VANNKWVEVEARSIDDAIKAGLNELNLEDATQANINILREPEGGVFGVGGTKALVRVSVRNGGSRNYTNKRHIIIEITIQKHPIKMDTKSNMIQKNQELKPIRMNNSKYQLIF